MDTAITALLKTNLSRGDTGQPFSVSANPMEMPQDTVKVGDRRKQGSFVHVSLINAASIYLYFFS